MTLVLSNDDVDKLLTMPACMEALELAYADLAQGTGVTRLRSDCFTPTAREGALYSLKSMDGVCPRLGVGAVRINSDIVVWPEMDGKSRRVKVPAAPGTRYIGLVLLFSCENGEPLAIMPDGVMQRMRVGATNGLAVKYLAREDARTIGILGSGWQAGTQLMGACEARAIEVIRCFSPNKANRENFSAEMSTILGVKVVPVESADMAVKDADIVMCATNTIDPVFFARLVQPGMHISSIKRPELDASVLERCDLLLIHSHDGKPNHVLAKGVKVPEAKTDRGWAVASIDFAHAPTLAEVIAGQHKGRTGRDQVTCFINNIGLGYQFAAAGSVVYRKAREQGVGRDLPTDWFTQDVHP
jgi:ornithine cyclodeaminase/alanine dehydrogenase-like protein (mu-crystallin family)